MTALALSTEACLNFVTLLQALLWENGPLRYSVLTRSARVSMRLIGAGYRRYSSRPEHFSPNYNRHRFRYILLAFSPGKTLALRFVVGISIRDLDHTFSYGHDPPDVSLLPRSNLIERLCEDIQSK